MTSCTWRCWCPARSRVIGRRGCWSSVWSRSCSPPSTIASPQSASSPGWAQSRSAGTWRCSSSARRDPSGCTRAPHAVCARRDHTGAGAHAAPRRVWAGDHDEHPVFGRHGPADRRGPAAERTSPPSRAWPPRAIGGDPGVDRQPGAIVAGLDRPARQLFVDSRSSGSNHCICSFASDVRRSIRSAAAFLAAGAEPAADLLRGAHQRGEAQPGPDRSPSVSKSDRARAAVGA